MDVFTDIAQKYISNKLIAGLEWDVRIKDKTLSRGVAGYKDSKSKDPLKENQIYRIFSMILRTE